MGRTWVLDTETKGTGARMVPIEEAHGGPAPEPELVYVAKKATPARPAPPEPEPAPPRVFKVIDALSREVLAEEVDTRATIELLGSVRSVVDVSIQVWEPRTERWRTLTLGERQLLWSRRES